MAEDLFAKAGSGSAVLWDGRPELGPRLPDLVAALVTFAVTFVVLGVGLANTRDWAWSWALPLAAVYAAVIGVAFLFGRSAGAGLVLTSSTAFWAAVATGAVITEQAGSTLLCPFVGAGAFLGALGLRFRQRRATRYQVRQGGRVLMGERGRYVIAFTFEALPTIFPDRYGQSLGLVDFGRVPGTLTTREGKVFKVPAQRRRFYRVSQPQELLEALQKAGPAPTLQA